MTGKDDAFDPRKDPLAGFHAEVGQAANVAQVSIVNEQVINVNGRPEWIQTLSEDQLRSAERRLLAASRYHETRSLVPIILPGMASCLMGAGLALVFHLTAGPVRGNDRWLALFMMLITFVPLWMGSYDMRRRHRRAVAVIEQRWAEVEAELALRRDVFKRGGVTPIEKLKQQLARRRGRQSA